MNDPDPRDPARNLLFGLLAFQGDIIAPGALLSAFEEWTADRSRPLGRILADRGEIPSDVLGLIEGRVAAYLARHDDDWETRVADPQADATLSYVAKDRDHGSNEAPNHSLGAVGVPTSSGARFRVLRPLNRGGMGVVSIALDTELDRSIALKEIRDSAADDRGYRARFLAEAEITGKLEHPGIIPIYGLGTYADGRPFYAMRLIRGDRTGSLMDAIERFHRDPDPSTRVVEFRGLLGRFLDVCNALSYAHSKGVLHRDLKPDNILLGPYGETLVVDWGLAKAAGHAEPVASYAEGDQVRLTLSGSELSPTMAGGAMGTPGYAPPEQLTGDLANVGPRSDVYGLGAILYCLMTGQAPFSRKGLDLVGLIKKVEGGDFPPPRLVRPGAAKPLEAICLKAMARVPEDRYESALALAADVERYLADEPVSAYREPWAARARRWTKKHRTAVTSAAATIVVALVALSVGLLIVGGLNRRLDIANKELKERKQTADTNFTLAVDAVRAQVFDIHEQLRDRAGTRDLREKLQRGATERLKSLTERASRRADADRATMWAHINLGDIYSDIDLKPSLARAEFEKAHDLATRLADADPANTLARRDLAVSYNRLGDLASRFGQPDRALQLCQKGLEGFESLARRADPADSNAQRDLLLAYGALGDVTLRTGQAAKALKHYQKGLDLAEALVKTYPAETQARRDLTSTYGNVGKVLLQTGQPAEALTLFQKRLILSEALAKANPDNVQAQRELSISFSKLGDATLRLGQPAEALKLHEKCLAVREALVKADPGNAEARRDLSYAHDKVADILLRMGQSTRALKFIEAGLSLREALAKADPADTRPQHDLSTAYGKLGDVMLRMGQLAEAAAIYRKGVAVSEALVKAEPTDVRARRNLAILYSRLGDIILQLSQPSESVVVYKKGLTLSEALAKADATDAQAQRDLASFQDKLGKVALQMGQPTEALRLFRISMTAIEAMAKADPADAQAQRDLANSYSDLGDATLLVGRTDEAVGLYKKGLALSEALAKADPTDAQARRDLALAYTRIGDLMLRIGQPEGASDYYEKALVSIEALAKADLADIRVQYDLSNAHARLGTLSLQLGQLARSREHFGKGLELGEQLSRAHPKLPDYSSALGQLLNNMALLDLEEKQFLAARSKLERAVIEQTKALAIRPRDAAIRQNLANHLTNMIEPAQQLGDAAGVAAIRGELAKLRDSDPAKVVALDARLAAVLKGQAIEDASERTQLAFRALEKALHVVSARLYSEALAAVPALGDDRQAGHRYAAACAAALAAAGKGKDDPPVDATAKVKLRSQALEWLKAELTAWKRVAMTAEPGNKELVAGRLKHWKTDVDLASIRDEEALNKLPEDERKAWQELWREVDSLLRRTERK